MDRRLEVTRQTVSVWLSALMLSLSLAVPIMERAELLHESVVESEHNPAHCPSAHDHTVCTQVGANLSAPADGPPQRIGHVFLRAPSPVEATAWTAETLPEGHPSRAPPLT